MNWEEIQLNWNRLHWNLKERWGKLTDAEIDAIAGRREELITRLERSYGVNRVEAERQITAWQQQRKDLDTVKQRMPDPGPDALSMRQAPPLRAPETTRSLNGSHVQPQ